MKLRPRLLPQVLVPIYLGELAPPVLRGLNQSAVPVLRLCAAPACHPRDDLLVLTLLHQRGAGGSQRGGRGVFGGEGGASSARDGCGGGVQRRGSRGGVRRVRSENFFFHTRSARHSAPR